MAKDKSKDKDKKKKDKPVKTSKSDRKALMKMGRYAIDDYDDLDLDKKKWWWTRANNNIPEVISPDEKKAEEEFREGKDWVFGTIEKTGSEQVDSKFAGVAKGVYAAAESPAKMASGKVSGKATGAISRALSKFTFAFKEKRKRKRNTLLIGGIVAGAATGAVIGTLLLPVIGTAIGGAIGAAIAGAAGLGAAVVLGTLGAWAGLASTRAASKRILPESKSNFKLSKRDLKKVNQNTNLDNIEIEKLHAYARNREKQLPDKSKPREKLRHVRQRAFKKGSKQAMEHLIFFLVDDLKALNSIKKPDSQQYEDQAFLIKALTKLEAEQDLSVYARNYIRTEIFNEAPNLELPEAEQESIEDITIQGTLNSVLDTIGKPDKPFVNNKTGERDVEVRTVKNQILRIRDILDKRHEKEPWEKISKVLNEDKGLNQLHKNYKLQEKIYELVSEALNERKLEAKTSMKKEGNAKLVKAKELKENPKKKLKVKRLEKTAGKLLASYEQVKQQAMKAEEALNALQNSDKPKKETPEKTSFMDSHRRV